MRKIFIIHGWTYTTTGWNDCLGMLRDKGVEAVMLRVPGLTEPSDKIWNLQSYVQWLDEKLSNEHDINLVVHSNGGRIAIEYINTHPGKIKKLILIDSAGLVRKHLPIRIKRFVFGGIAKTAKHIINIDFARKIFYKLIRAKDYERAPVNMRETMKNLVLVDLKDKLKSIHVPTLIIWGKKDKETPVADAYTMNREIVGSKLEIIDNARHSPHMSHPEVTAHLIADFL